MVLRNKIFNALYDLVNTKEKRKLLLIICVPFYTVYGITTYMHHIGLSENVVSTVLATGYITWLACLWLFFFQTKTGKKLWNIIERGE